MEQHQPQQVIGVEPGDLRVRSQLDDAIKLVAAYASNTGARGLKPYIDWREDKHFLCSLPQFRNWAGKSASLRMEFFYRTMRKQYKVLMEGDQPVGGQWNFDAENRKGFGKAGPQDVPAPLQFKPDSITAEVIALVENNFADHPGDLSRFNWPVTREQALMALDDFIEHRLPHFGAHQHAMWTGLDFGWHALLSSSLNLKPPTLYWNFLDQHEAAFADNPRTALMVKNLQRMTPELRSEVRARASEMLAALDFL